MWYVLLSFRVIIFWLWSPCNLLVVKVRSLRWRISLGECLIEFTGDIMDCIIELATWAKLSWDYVCCLPQCAELKVELLGGVEEVQDGWDARLMLGRSSCSLEVLEESGVLRGAAAATSRCNNRCFILTFSSVPLHVLVCSCSCVQFMFKIKFCSKCLFLCFYWEGCVCLVSWRLEGATILSLEMIVACMFQTVLKQLIVFFVSIKH